jgi:hypothetical protein
MALDFPAAPVDGQVYDNYIWVAALDAWRRLPIDPAIPLGNLADVTLTSPVAGQSLIYDGSGWINRIPPVSETTEKITDYTIGINDAGLVVQMNKATAGTVTIPTDASVAFPLGTIVNVYNRGTNDITIVGEAGVTVRNSGVVSQYKEASLRKRAENEWVAVGAL